MPFHKAHYFSMRFDLRGAQSRHHKCRGEIVFSLEAECAVVDIVEMCSEYRGILALSTATACPYDYGPFDSRPARTLSFTSECCSNGNKTLCR